MEYWKGNKKETEQLIKFLDYWQKAYTELSERKKEEFGDIDYDTYYKFINDNLAVKSYLGDMINLMSANMEKKEDWKKVVAKEIKYFIWLLVANIIGLLIGVKLASVI